MLYHISFYLVSSCRDHIPSHLTLYSSCIISSHIISHYTMLLIYILVSYHSISCYFSCVIVSFHSISHSTFHDSNHHTSLLITLYLSYIISSHTSPSRTLSYMYYSLYRKMSLSIQMKWRNLTSQNWSIKST